MIKRLTCQIIAMCFAAVCFLATSSLTTIDGQRCQAESALELLGKFDAERLQAAYPPGNKKTFEELSKLIYRIGRVQPESIRKRVTPDQMHSIGDATVVSGTIKSMRLLRVPAELVDVLEFPSVADIVIQVDSGGESDEREADKVITINVIGPALPKSAAVGDRIEAVGVVIAQDDRDLNDSAPSDSDPNNSDQGNERSAKHPVAVKYPMAMASAKMKWTPLQLPSDGWRLLSEAGVDISELGEVASRNRKRLTSADNKPFYEILAAAPEIAASPLAAQLEPRWIRPIELLQAPKEHVGEWLRIRLNTVRVTKVAVTDPDRQEQLGHDHYYQIDASGDLEDIVIEIQRPPGEEGPPVLFDGSYPVSLVARELPPFLSQAIRDQEGDDAVVAMISLPIQVEGFFFRLWSYESDKMQREGAGNQFGPLMMVARMTDRTTAVEAQISVDIIGYLAAAGIFLGLLGAFLWTRRNAGEDKEVRVQRQTRESSRLDFPSEE